MFMRKLGVRPSAQTPLTVAKSLCVVPIVLLLAACTHVEIEDHSLQFNRATGSLSNRVMLLNVVRSAKGYPVQFSKLTSYRGSGRVEGGLNLTLPFILNTIGMPSASRIIGEAEPSSSFNTGVNSMELADLSTAEFQRALRKQVTANDFVYYRTQGWPNALVNTLLIEEVYVEPRLLHSLRSAAKVVCDNLDALKLSRSERERRKEQCRWLESNERCLEYAREERASAEGDVVRVLSNNPRIRCTHESFQWFFTSINVLPTVSLAVDPKVNPDDCTSYKARLKDLAGRAMGGKGKSKGTGRGTNETVKDGKVSVEVNVRVAEKAGREEDASDKSKDVGVIGLNISTVSSPQSAPPSPANSALSKLRNDNLCILREGKVPVIITWRSPERMVRYLGEVLAVQAFGPGKRKIEILNENGRLVELLRVESGRYLLGRRAAVSVEGPEGESFSIPIPERTSSTAHLSLQTLALAMEAVNLAVSGKELPRAPAIFLSGG